MRASIVVVILSLLFSACIADFSFSTFTQSDVDNDFSVVANAEFDAASNSLQIVPSKRNNVGAAFHINLQPDGNYAGEYIAPGFITEFTFQINAIVGLGGAGVALVLQPNGAINVGTTGAGMGYGDYQNGQQGILNSLAIEFDVYQDASMGDPNANHVGVHSKGNNPNSSNETAVILGLVNTTIPAIQTGNGTQHTVYVEYQAVPNTLQVLLDGQQVLFSNAFNLTEWILLEPGTGESFIGITSSTNTVDLFELDILSWSFYQGNGTVVPASTQIYGPGYVSATFNETNIYYIQLIDQFGYNLTQNQVTPTCAIAYGTDTANLTNIACSASYISGGLYEASYVMTLTGEFTLITTVDTYTNTSLLTVTAPPFAANCIASGPGLTSSVAGEIATFTITTYDATGAPSTGDAAFAITLTLVSNSSIVFTGQASAPDGTGVYTATYNVTVSGDYSLSVVLVGQSDIQGSPFSVTVTAAAYSAANSYAYGPGITTGGAGATNYFFVQATDAFGNFATSPTSWNIASGNGNAVSGVNSTLVSGNPTLTNNTYVQTVVGTFPLEVTDVNSGVGIQGSPFDVTITPGLATPGTTVATGSSTGTAGVIGTITITPADQFGNLVNDSSLVFDANFTGPATYLTTATYNTDGTYTVTYNLTVAGDYQVFIALASGGLSAGYISSTPFGITISPGAVSVQNSYATGQGLTSAQAGVSAGFTIQTVDEYNNTITTGSSTVFTVTFDPSFNGTVEPVLPNNDGTYSVTYVAYNMGTFNLSVTSGSESIIGSPFSVVVVAGLVSIPNCYATGEGLSTAQAGVTANFTIQTVDGYGNLITYGNDTIFDVTFDGNATVNPVVPNNDGTYFASYVSFSTGTFNLSVTSGSESIQGSPFPVVVSPGPAAGNYSVPSGTGLTSAVAGENATFIVEAYDEFDNPLTGYGGPCTGYLEYQVDPFTNYTITCTYSANNTYDATYNVTVAGDYQLFLFINGEAVQTTPSAVTVSPGPLNAPTSTAAGPGLTQAISGVVATFNITARDQFGNPVLGDPLGPAPFNVTLTNGNDIVSGIVLYVADGVYNVTYTLITPTGDWSLDITSFGVAIAGSPSNVVLLPGVISAANSFAFPDPLPDGVAYENYFFLVQAVDINGNNETSNVGVTFDAVITLDVASDNQNLADVVVPSTYYQNGQYQFNFNLTSGQYTVAVSLNSTQIKNSPLALTVAAGLPAANTTIASGAALNFSRAGELSNFTITTYDLGGVAYTTGGQNFSVSLSLGTGNDTMFANDNVTITDNGDGTYAGQYYLTLVGTWELSINLTSGPYPGPINGVFGPSPFYPVIYAGENCPENAEVLNLSPNITVNVAEYFQIQSKDCFGNDVLSSEVYYDVLVEGPDCSFGNSSYVADGLYNVTYVVSLPGNYTININERGTPINGNPYPVTAAGEGPESGLSSTSLLYMWLFIVFLVLYVLVCLALIAFVVITQRKQLQRNFSNYKKIQSDSSSSSSSD